MVRSQKQPESSEKGSKKRGKEPEQRKFRLVGVFMAPPLTQEQQADAESKFRAAINDDGIAIQRLPVFRPPALPVFEDESGSRFVFIPDESGRPMPVPFGGEATEMDLAAARGGFVMLDTDHSDPNEGVDLGALRAAAVQMLGMHGGFAPEMMGGSDAAGDRHSRGGSLEALGQGLGYAPAAFNMLGGPMAGMDSILNGIGQFGLGHLMSMGTQQLLGKLFSVGDGSSFGSQLGARAGQQLAGELQSMAQGWLMDQVNLGNGQGGAAGAIEGYKKKLEVIFNGVEAGVSNASVPVGRLGDGNSASGAVAAGAGTVLVNSIPAARIADLATMSTPDSDAGPIQTGNPTILVEGQPLAGDGHIAVGTGKGIVGVLQGCSGDVFMGPVGMPVAVIPGSQPADHAEENSTTQSSPDEVEGSVSESDPLENSGSDSRDGEVIDRDIDCDHEHLSCVADTVMDEPFCEYKPLEEETIEVGDRVEDSEGRRFKVLMKEVKMGAGNGVEVYGGGAVLYLQDVKTGEVFIYDSGHIIGGGLTAGPLPIGASYANGKFYMTLPDGSQLPPAAMSVSGGGSAIAGYSEGFMLFGQSHGDYSIYVNTGHTNSIGLQFSASSGTTFYNFKYQGSCYPSSSWAWFRSMVLGWGDPCRPQK